MHYFVKGRNRHWTYLVLPLAGCAVCLYIWFSLRWQARLVGFSWLFAGAIYAFIRRRSLAKSPIIREVK
jgi:hypothetical protein